MKYPLILPFVLLLSACEKTPEEIRQEESKIEEKLPEGCTFKYLGYFFRGEGGYDPIYMVYCKSLDATVTTTQLRQGKTNTPIAIIRIDEKS